MNQMLESNASGPDGGIRVRDAADEDIAVIQAIYAHHVLNGISTFEEIPPSHQYHAILALKRSGQDFTARMMAAEALARI